MKTIWKYTIPVDDYSEVVGKRGAVPLHVYPQGERLIDVWMAVDTDRTEVAYSFFVVGTGHPLPEKAEYIGTVHAGRFVWHVFYSRK